MMIEEKMLAFALAGAGWVLWLLVGLSVLCVTIAVERWVFGMMNRTKDTDLQAVLGPYLQGGDLDGLKSGLEPLTGMEARVLGAGAEAASHGPDAAEEAMAGTLVFERLRLERGLIVLASTGANAPFLGLFGTVLGIIQAFHDLSLDAADSGDAVMAGISEALVATAVGLIVAIPAVVLYNYFARRNRDVLQRIQSLSHLVLSRLKANPAASSEAS
jgi:biopolymer transport protein ExbB